MSVTPTREIIFTDEDGDRVIPEYMDRVVHHERERIDKGPKVRSRHKSIDGLVSMNGLFELSKYEAVFVLDTNRRIFDGKEVSAAAFICCYFRQIDDKFHVTSDGQLNVFELHEVPSGKNPEMLALLKLANDIVRSRKEKIALNIAFITDSELGSHDPINQRTTPIYGTQYLPAGFSIHYASSDSGSEAVNRLIRFCNKASTDYLSYLAEGTIKPSPFSQLAEEPAVHFRRKFRNDFEIVNPVIEGVSGGFGYELYGWNDSPSEPLK